jgi:hypothetical protein
MLRSCKCRRRRGLLGEFLLRHPDFHRLNQVRLC